MRNFFLTLTFFLAIFSSSSLAWAELGWKDCVEEAQKNNPELIAAREKIKQSRHDYTSTQSGLLPSVAGYGDLSATRVTGAERADSYSYGLTGKQLIFDGLKTNFNLAQAKANIEIAEHSYKSVSATVRLKLRVAFVELLRIQELIKLTKSILKRRSDNLAIVESRFKEGKEEQQSSVSVYRASLDQAQFEIEQAQRRVEFAQRQLIKELGRKEFSSLQVKGELKLNYPYDKRPDLDYLVNQHPELKILLSNNNSNELGVKAAKSNLLPQVYASVDASRSDVKWPPRDSSWTAGLSVSVPIFEGGSRVAQVSKSQSKLVQSQAEERGDRDGIILNMEQTWNALQDAMGSLKVQQSIFEATTERAISSKERYISNEASFNDWSVIENDFVNESKAFLAARANALFTEASWAHAKGWSLDDPL